MGTSTASVIEALTSRLGPDRVRTGALERHAMAHDASHYLLVPQAVVLPRTGEDIAVVMRGCSEAGVPVTFRGGGTSLSGQGVTDGVLVDTRRHFRGVQVLDDGTRVRVGPGTTIGIVNRVLVPYGRRLGPDPASEGACTVGGMVANNSSGMQCGTRYNTYATLESASFVLPSGTHIDSADPGAGRRLWEQEPELVRGLERLRDRVRDNAESVATIRRLFALKNTMGYGINAFLDHDDPLDILVHLLVGSEGTLAFVGEVVMRTVEVLPHTATGLLVFDTIERATSVVPDLVATGTATAELLDAASLRVSATDPGCPAIIRDLRIDRQAAMLVEFQAATDAELDDIAARVSPVLASLPGVQPTALSRDAGQRSALWRLRKGLYSAVAGARPTGSNALLEDIVVDPAVLGSTCAALTGLFARHSYEESVIFGHAKDGNIHFMLNERFDDPARMRRYEAFTEDMVDLVLGQGGSLKAEHGTGRIMAPFVRRQYGDELYEVMGELKRLFDPAGILNPASVLSDDPGSYLRDLKPQVPVEEEVTQCVECGFCEPVCPSKDLTLTPRQRIVLRREAASARERGDATLADELERDYDYPGVQTCAVDGMCQTACPVHINTGDLVRRLRGQQNSPVGDALWRGAALGWRAAVPAAAAGLSAARRIPAPVRAATAVGRVVLGSDTVPRYDAGLPAGGRPGPTLHDDHAQAVLFSACIGQMFGEEPGDGDLLPAGQAFATLAGRAGLVLRTVDGPGLCCGTPWKSKGRTSGYEIMRARVVPAVREATDDGRLPLVVDASSCTEGMAVLLHEALPQVEVVDAVDLTARHLIDRLTVSAPIPSMVLHPTCSGEIAGSTPSLRRLAEFISAEVTVPAAWGCCGFAGDRGLLHPELTASATAAESAEVTGLDAAEYASCNRTCEIGMTRATGRTYRNILALVERATR